MALLEPTVGHAQGLLCVVPPIQWPADTLLNSIDNALSVPDHVLEMTQQISNAADT